MLLRLTRFCRFSEVSSRVLPANFSGLLDHLLDTRVQESETLEEAQTRVNLMLCALDQNTLQSSPISDKNLLNLVKGAPKDQETLSKILRVLLGAKDKMLECSKRPETLSSVTRYIQALSFLKKVFKYGDDRILATRQLDATLTSLQHLPDHFAVAQARMDFVSLNYLLWRACEEGKGQVYLVLLNMWTGNKKMSSQAFLRFLVTFLRMAKSNVYEVERYNLVHCFRNHVLPAFLEDHYRAYFGQFRIFKNEECFHKLCKIFEIILVLRLDIRELSSMSTRLEEIAQLVGSLSPKEEHLRIRQRMIWLTSNLGHVPIKMIRLARADDFFGSIAKEGLNLDPNVELWMLHFMAQSEIAEQVSESHWRQSTHPSIRVYSPSRSIHEGNVITSSVAAAGLKGFITNKTDAEWMSRSLKGNYSKINVILMRRLMFYLSKVKGFDLPEITIARQVLDQYPPEDIPANPLSVSMTSIYLQKLLEEMEGVTVTREVAIDAFTVDFLVKLDDKPHFILELDGPLHFRSDGSTQPKNTFREFCLMKAGYKVVSIRGDYLETVITMERERELINAIFNQVKTNSLLKVGFESQNNRA